MKAFQTESKRILDLMINSVYKNREIFLRELISNASDAIDKMYYKSLTDDDLTFNADDYYIKITTDSEARTLTIEDTGIGMNASDMESHLGIIANSGSFKFKNEAKIEDNHEIIGQFGVGFYSAFLVAKKVDVYSSLAGEATTNKWSSEGAEGYTLEQVDTELTGTKIVLTLKDNTEDESYDDFLQTHTLRRIIKKYSDFIRYPIKLDVTTSQLKEGSEDEYEEVTKEEIINSQIPIWKKNKSELTDEDYVNFYREKHFGFDQPLLHTHISVDGNVSYQAILYVPGSAPFDFHTPDYKKGLELYSSGVLIMDKCEDLVPDYFNFVKGIVDSEDLSLNISREVLQNDRQLTLIAKNLQTKIKNELAKLMKNDFDQYVSFFESFGRTLKFGVYSDFGANKEVLQDLLIFESSHEDKYTSLAAYVERMSESQEAIYYATGESKERIKKSPQAESLLDAGHEILYFTHDVDEFAIKMLMTYAEKPFKPAAEFKAEGDSKADEEANETFKDIFEAMGEKLEGKVSAVQASSRLKRHPVALGSKGEISIEMEKVMNAMPNGGDVQAEKVLEVNTNHEIFAALKAAQAGDESRFELLTHVLYNQARLIEGLDIEDPVGFAQNVSRLIV
ncbi:MAG: molecular chaperone HtpG [Defluviitaleaceae bacterium]|nr:molecular chaperone HtpG [Defluviitaleaceae bacterium]